MRASWMVDHVLAAAAGAGDPDLAPKAKQELSREIRESMLPKQIADVRGDALKRGRAASAREAGLVRVAPAADPSDRVAGLRGAA